MHLHLWLLLQAVTGGIEGTVRAGAGAPIADATVAIPALDRRTQTDPAGRFALRDVPARTWELVVSAPGYDTLRLRVEVADRIVRLDVGLTVVAAVTGAPRPQELPPLIVTAPRATRPMPIAAPGDFADVVATGRTRLDRRRLESVPATFEPDVLRALQSTAGVGAANDVNAHLAIRGGAPEHTLHLLDGAPVLGPYHMFGLFGAFSPDAVDEAQILRGSLPARIGGALGSVVSLRSLRPARLRIAGGATVLTSRLAASGPLGERGSWLVAGRRTNLAFGGSGPFDLDIPYWFWDLQGTLRVEPGRNQEITVSSYGSGDKFAEDFFFLDAGTAPLFSTWRNRVGSVTWRVAPVSGWSGSLAAWYSGYRSTLALDDTTLRADSAATHGSTRLAGLSAAVARSFATGAIRLGVDVTENRAALIGDSLAPGYLDDRVDRRLTEVSASLELERRIGAIRIAPGLRATRWSAGERGTVEPRLAVSWAAGRATSVAVSAGRTVQALFALRDDRLPILGVPFWTLPDSLEPRAAATAFEIAVTAEPAAGWELDASVFHRRLSGIARWRPTGQRTLAELEYDDGTATGLELSLVRRSGRLTGWVTYTPLVARLTQGDGTRYRPLWDRRHALGAVTQLRLGRWGVLSQRMSFATGQPFWVEQGTFNGSEFDPLTGTVRDRTDASFPVWSRTQATLPAYFRLDLTASAFWQIGRVRLASFAGLVNITGRRNVLGYQALPGSIDGRIELIPRKQLPRFPVLGVDFSIGWSAP